MSAVPPAPAGDLRLACPAKCTLLPQAAKTRGDTLAAKHVVGLACGRTAAR